MIIYRFRQTCELRGNPSIGYGSAKNTNDVRNLLKIFTHVIRITELQTKTYVDDMIINTLLCQQNYVTIANSIDRTSSAALHLLYHVLKLTTD